MRQVALVFLCGGFGSAARYLMAGWVLRTFGAGFAYGTIAINTLGSFLIVLVMQLGMAQLISADTRIALATGVMGGFTTYSTFNYETLSFFQQGAWLLGALNVLVTVFICLAAGGLGLLLSRALIPA
jgi:fluoride exporter